MADGKTNDSSDLSSSEHKLYFSNRLSLMPDSTELGALISSYGRLLKAYKDVLVRIDPELMTLELVPELIRYEASGSGELDWLIKYCWGSTEKAQKWAADVIKKNPKLRWLHTHRKGIGAVILALITIASYVKSQLNTAGSVDEADEPATPHLSGIQQQTINIAAAEYGIAPETFRRMLIDTLRNDPSLLRDVSRVVRPARRDPNAYMQLDGEPLLSLKPEAIAEIPPTLSVDPEPREIRHTDVLIQLRATDLDNRRRWAAIIPSISPRRVTLVVDVNNPSELAGVTKLRGNIVAEEVLDEDSEWVPRRYRLTFIERTDRQPSLYPESPDAGGASGHVPTN